ncbi:MAG: DUF4912 domain-containing protein [Gammaproteobacteria bacterium]
MSGNLSRLEMRDIGLDISRRFAPRPSVEIQDFSEKYHFSTRELASISEAISRDFALPEAETHIHTDAELVLLPVDPDHVHAYWQVDADKGPTSEEKPPTLILRIYIEAGVTSLENANGSYLEFKVDAEQGHRKIALPEASSATRYSAVIGRNLPNAGFIAYARSRSVYVPRIAGGIYFFRDRSVIPGLLPTLLRRYESGQGKL